MTDIKSPIRQSTLVYYRCPKCLELGAYATFTDYVQCGRRWCGSRFFYPAHDLTREEYLVKTWGSLEEHRKFYVKATAYISKWAAARI